MLMDDVHTFLDGENDPLGNFVCIHKIQGQKRIGSFKIKSVREVVNKTNNSDDKVLILLTSSCVHH